MKIIEYISTSINTLLNMDGEVPMIMKVKCTIKLDLKSKFIEIIDEKIDENDHK
jgi:hypothetical protein